MKKLLVAAALGMMASVLFGEIQIIDGVKYECKDGMCMPVEEDEDAVPSMSPSTGADTENLGTGLGDAAGETHRGTGSAAIDPVPRCVSPAAIAQGYMKADAFIAFLRNEKSDDPLSTSTSNLNLDSTSTSFLHLLATLLLILLGGLAMNLTPCVLPMIPINLMIIGKSAARGAWYGLGIALAYGVLGVLAAVGGMAFGTIQANPWFNLGIAILFVILALALADVFCIDLSKKRAGLAQKKQTMLPGLFAFFMGVVSAVLAGACVAPILISVLLLTAKLYAEGQTLALGLPFVLGLGMALPWPFLGAGFQVLPKPGAWMKGVNRAVAVLVLGAAAWYGWLAWQGFSSVPRCVPARDADEPLLPAAGETRRGTVLRATPETLPALLSSLNLQPQPGESAKPILIDCWATWCKNCAAMERVMAEPTVAEELKNFTVIKLQAEDMKALKQLPGFGEIRGLPAFVILPPLPPAK